MEGYLQKKEGFFSGLVQYYFILHEDMLVYLDKKGGKPVGSIHMKVAKIQPDKKDKLLISIFNGTNEVVLKANSIKEMVEWTNAIVQCQKLCLEGRYDHYKKKNSKGTPTKTSLFSNNMSGSDTPERLSVQSVDKVNWYDQLNMKFCSKVFLPDSPFFVKLGQVWELEAQLQEVLSLLIPEANRTKQPLIIEYADQITRICEDMKEKMADCFNDMEDTRKEMFRVAKQMVRMKDTIINGKQTNQHSIIQKSPSSQSGGTSPFKQLHHQQITTPTKNRNGYNQQFQSPEQQRDYYSNEIVAVNNHQNVNGNLNHQNRLGNYSQDQYNTQQKAPSNQLIKSDNRGVLQQAHLNNNQLLYQDDVHDLSSQGYSIPQTILNNLPNGMYMGFGGIPISYNLRMREALPALIPENQSYSIWAILKSAVGKDMTRITMPIWLNEPISMLQKISEFTHYQDIMERAVKLKDDYKKIAYISVFVMSQYSDVFLRNRKPFNPILGETFELIQPNFRLMCEQVSHHPPITAFHLEGNGYYTHGDTDVRSHFWGSSLEFRTVGLQHLYLTETNEHFIIKRPDNSANNLIVGKLYVDVHGTLEITNVTKNIKFTLTIHRQGWTKKNAYRVEGIVVDADGKKRYEVGGRWNESLYVKDLSNGVEETVFKADPKPPLCERMYGFNYFTINLNYINDEMKQSLPPTDCRRRSDQRLMEEAKYDQAAEEKHRLEEKQRSMRKQREEMGIEYKPRFFQQVKDEFNGEKMYQFNHIYWDKRKKQDYADLPDLF